MVNVDLDDERFNGVPLDVSFHGELRPEQQKAADALLAHDMGILSATTAFGKTVVAAWVIAARKVNTLILVHRRQLLDQWRERLSVFLNLPVKSIGQIGGGCKKPTGLIDVAVIQSLSRKHVVNDLVAGYGQVIVDECHHLSAFSFEQVLRQAKAKYVLGLTATPMRKDGHHPIILMQCGPVRYRVNARDHCTESVALASGGTSGLIARAVQSPRHASAEPKACHVACFLTVVGLPRFDPGPEEEGGRVQNAVRKYCRPQVLPLVAACVFRCRRGA